MWRVRCCGRETFTFLARGATQTMAKRAGARPGGPHSPSTDEIPDKLYFRIGEVANLCKVETYVLRFWQTEFPQLKPVKSGTGQRLYRRRDVETALRIKRLLHEEGYTIAGARQVFAAEAIEHRQVSQPASQAGREHSAHISAPASAARPADSSPLAAQPELPLVAPQDRAREGEDRAAARETDRAQVLLARLRLELGEIHGMLSRTSAASLLKE